ncbi:IS200/IS605 family transposase [Marinagarivorans cellulosilyticus]|uniref:Transposase IS200-like domain-containing protein n=1 Tax=Marinagarivorans cellulosilyticus TaxID=2721545 RepID=A0AAN1WI92_9GAMM|nr:hypothetical protein MARGE09_P2255 [Marinagarivorans cellulosilyticus]
MFDVIRKHLGEVFQDLARQKGVVVEGWHLMSGHVRVCLSFPPKLAVSNVVGFIKGKSAISIARKFKGRKRSFNGEAFWRKGYYVSTYWFR